MQYLYYYGYETNTFLRAMYEIIQSGWQLLLNRGVFIHIFPIGLHPPSFAVVGLSIDFHHTALAQGGDAPPWLTAPLRQSSLTITPAVRLAWSRADPPALHCRTVPKTQNTQATLKAAMHIITLSRFLVCGTERWPSGRALSPADLTRTWKRVWCVGCVRVCLAEIISSIRFSADPPSFLTKWRMVLLYTSLSPTGCCKC